MAKAKPAAKKRTAKKSSASRILGATMSFVFARALVYLGIIAAMLAIGAIGALICVSLLKKGLAVFTLIVFIIFFGGLFGFLRFARRYLLYMVKAAHIAAITQYIKTGKAPSSANGYKGVFAYGAEKVKSSFVSANVAFVADALIAGATRQIMRWANKAQNLLSFIPGAKTVMRFLNLVLAVALNYIDEAILSYVFCHDTEKNGFKKACDGLVLYAQSWKNMLKGALKVAAFIWILRIALFIIFYSIFIPLAVTLVPAQIAEVVIPSQIALTVGIIAVLIFILCIEALIVDPFATCVMINDYHKAIAGQSVKADLHGTLCKVSRKFRSLFEKSKQPVRAVRK